MKTDLDDFRVTVLGILSRVGAETMCFRLLLPSATASEDALLEGNVPWSGQRTVHRLDSFSIQDRKLCLL